MSLPLETHWKRAITAMQVLVGISKMPTSKKNERSRSTEDTVRRLARFFEPLCTAPLVTYSFQSPIATILYLELEREQCNWSFVQEDKETFVASCGYPRFWQKVLDRHDRPSRNLQPLPELCRRLQASPRRVLRDLCPPFLLMWISKGTGELWIANDGLGLAQAFHLESGGRNACSNKLFAAALATGHSPKLCVADWKNKLALGWFPADRTGFEAFRFLSPGTLLHLSAAGMKKETVDVVSTWTLSDSTLCQNDLVGECNDAIKASVSDSLTYWDNCRAALSGGWDSRLVVSAALATNNKIPTYTTDRVFGFEARVAKRLAKLARLTWVREFDQMPGSEQLSTSTDSFVRWMAGDGYIENGIEGGPEKLKNVRCLTIGGNCGEPLRGYFYSHVTRKSDADVPSVSTIIEAFSESLIKDVPIKHPGDLELTRESITQICKEAIDHGIQGLNVCDYVYLMLKARRWGSTGISGRFSHFRMSPLLTPRTIQILFSLQPALKSNNRLVREIIQRNVPQWAVIPTAHPRLRANRIVKNLDRWFWRTPICGARYNHVGYLRDVCYDSMLTTLQNPCELVDKVVDTRTALEIWNRMISPVQLRTRAAPSRFFFSILSLAALDRLLAHEGW